MSQQTEHGHKTFTAGEALAQYRRVKLDASSGTTVVYADADDAGLGVTQGAADNGDQVTVRLWSAPGSFKLTAGAALAAGVALTGADDGKVTTLTGTGLGLTAAEAASADASIIEGLPASDGGSGPLGRGGALLFANTADSSTVTNTTTETTFDQSLTLDGNVLQVGDVLRITARVAIPSTNATDTLTLRVKVGTENVLTTAAVDVADNDIGYLQALVTVRAAGASGSLAGTGVYVLDAAGTAQTVTELAAASEDLSVDVVIGVSAEWSVASASNQCDLEQLVVELLRL